MIACWLMMFTEINTQYEEISAQYEANLIAEGEREGGGGDKIKLKQKPQRQTSKRTIAPH